MFKRSALKPISFVIAFTLVMLVAACSSGNNNNNNAKNAAANTKENTTNTAATSNDTAAANNEADNAAAEPVQEVDKTPVEITISTWVPADSPEWHKISDAFTKKYPWITVKWLFNDPGPNTIKAVTQSIAAGEPIDIFWNPTFVDVVQQGLAEDLTPYLEDPEYKEYQFSKGILEPFQYQGKQYGLSRGNDTFIFFYNKDILDKYGIDAPKNDWSWTDLVDMAKKATHPEDKVWGIANDVILTIFAGANIAASNGHSDHIMDLNGDLQNTITYVGSDQNVMDDHQFMMDWVSKDGIMLNDKRVKDAGLEGDIFATGHAAFYYHVSPTIPGFKSQWKFKWDIAPTPKGTAKQVGTSFNNPMFLTKAGKHKEQAFQFMKFWAATVEGQKILMDIGGSLPNSTVPEITDHFKQMETYKGLNVDALLYAASIGEVDPTIFIPGGAEVSATNSAWGTDAFQKETSAYDYFPTVADKANKAIADAMAKMK
ncbi:extracellular solute-binding protein [Paenibacillus lignilyticus]|uniref:Extracellular solute-binding protein n=1 Tax=Paenibacillus lignilyticus TaxID=1172615 RepID=A0ABS5C8N9_9BACL|nr:extracellular solute-binding protein [Paenibacillus lignilyticus]MBP3962190.1 extracellular solute-binding protein [Paenibacillus lignilyticus]